MLAHLPGKTALAAEDTRNSTIEGGVTDGNIEFKQASQWDEIEGAYRLLYESYLKRGLINPNRIGLRYTHYNLLPETATFVGLAEGKVVATLSVIPESMHFPLPMSCLYSEEIDQLHSDGSIMAEGSGLAIDPSYQSMSLDIVMSLIKMAVVYSRKLGCTDNVIACHPRHARFYRKLFLFEEIGGLRTYSAVNDAPAVALKLDLVRLRDLYRSASGARGESVYRFFFSDDLFRCPDTALRAGAFSQSTVRKLCEMQPSVTPELEAGEPGIVERLTGRVAPARIPSQRTRAWTEPLWEVQPIFVAA